MTNINIGDVYYLIEADNKSLLELRVSKVAQDGDETLIFFISDKSADYWNGAYSVSEYNIGKFIFPSKEEAIQFTKEYKNKK